MQKTTRSICIIDALIQYFLSLLIAMAFGAAPMMANADTLPSLSKDSLCHASLSPPASVVFANPTFHPVANIWTTRAAVISALQDHNYALAAHNYRDLTGFVAGVTSYHFARTEYFIEHRFKDGYIAIFQNNFCGTSDQIAPPAIDDGDDIVYRRALLFLISGQLGKARTLLLPISSQYVRFSLAKATVGLIAYQEGHLQEARTWWLRAAIDTDNTLPEDLSPSPFFAIELLLVLRP